MAKEKLYCDYSTHQLGLGFDFTCCERNKNLHLDTIGDDFLPQVFQ